MKNNPWYYWTDKLVKEPKPCMPGNKVHIKKWDGCYTVHNVYLTHFTIMKNRILYNVPWEYFICLKGQGQSAESLLKRGVRTTLLQVNVLTSTLNNVLKDLRK